MSVRVSRFGVILELSIYLIMNRILVTGGLGFIGSHTVVELQNSGFEVVIIDDLSNTTIEVLDNITEITGVKPEFHQNQ